MNPLFRFCVWLSERPSSIALHKSVWVYPIIESVHVLGLTLFVGLAILMDVRLAGIGLRKSSASYVARQVLPWIIAGFIPMVISGTLLFYSNPVKFYGNIFFRVKAVLLILAGLNVFVFHNGVWRRVDEWALDPRPPRSARIAGFLSLALWAFIIVAGRLIAYNWYQ